MAGKNTKAKMDRFDTLRTPKGTAGFSYLREPDESFGGANHRIQLFVDKNDPEVKAFVQKLNETKAKFLKLKGKKDDKKIPAMKKADAYLAEKFGDYGVKEGDLYFEFRSKARQDDGGDWKFIDIFDVKGQPAPDLRVFGGDVIRVSVTLMGYVTGQGSGIKPYLNSVQVLQKKNNGYGASKNVFEDESAEFGEPEATDSSNESTFKDESSEQSDESYSNDVDLSDLV